MSMQSRWAGFRADRSKEGGYVAVMTALLLIVLMGLAAFAVDVGRWYVVGQQEQRAADAAALAGVTSLPGDMPGAVTNAKNFSKVNGFDGAVSGTTVTAGQDGRPTRLRVTVSRTVSNIFGPLLGVPTTTISRTAVADFGGPVPMGSPCNEFGNDPEPGSNQGVACTDVTGQMWANVNSPSSGKGNGDAYQSKSGCSSAVDGCSGSTNSDYNPDGYFYTVSVKASMPSLTIQLFDPVFVDVGLFCDPSTSSPQVTTNFGGNGTSLATAARNDVVTDEATRYKPGSTEPYCTGDASFSSNTSTNNNNIMATQFTVHDPSASLWDPATFLVHTGCVATSGTPVPGGSIYPGYSGPLFNVLNKGDSKYSANIVDGFRRWTTLCTIPNPVVGDYLIQVKTNVGTPYDKADTTNHFALRAFGSNPGENSSVSVSGRERMGMYSNKPGATNEFHLARVPSGAAGQLLRLRLFDVGDSNQSGTIYIVYPPLATGGPSFTGCQGSGPASGPLTGCSFSATSSFNGKWQTVSVPIPSTYSCDDLDPRACWVRLKYDYGSGSAPHDVTTWTAGIDGDPVRLVE